MRTWQKMAACVAALVITSGASIAAAHTTGGAGNGQPTDDPPPAATSDIGGGVTNSTFVPIAPCRVVDTRVKGGPIASNQSRSFYVTGTQHFIDQGGKVGGCGIPAGSTAVEISVTSVDSTGNGFLRAFPAGAAEPTATFLNYSPYNPTNTGTVQLCQGTCTTHLSVKGHGSSTQLVIDVQGYYSKPLAALITSAGILNMGSHTVASARLVAGQYEVIFDRDVSQCTYDVLPNALNRFVLAQPRSGNANGVFVQTSNASQSLADAAFYLTVTC
jgi:hypothetical protein